MAALDNGRLDIRAAWVVLKSQPLSSASGPPPSQLLPGKNVLPMGSVRSFCWAVPCLTFLASPSRCPPPPSSMGAKEPPPPRSAPSGPENARSDCDIGVCNRGFVFGEQNLQGGRGAARRGQSWPLTGHIPLSLQPHRCKGPKWWGRVPPVPGIFWVEGECVPQASACVCYGSKGISCFSQFIRLIHLVVVFLAPLSLPGPTEDS